MNGHQKQKEQSGRMIERALFALMKEKDYARITVSEIVKRADISRRTFYRLYKEKDEVLHCYFGRLCWEYSRKISVLERYDIAQIAGEYFGFWYQYRNFLLLLHRSGLDGMLYYEIGRVSVEIIKGRIDEDTRKKVRGIEYFAAYSTGGFSLLLQRWITMGMKETPEEYAKVVSEALLKFIAPAGRDCSSGFKILEG